MIKLTVATIRALAISRAINLVPEDWIRRLAWNGFWARGDCIVPQTPDFTLQYENPRWRREYPST